MVPAGLPKNRVIYKRPFFITCNYQQQLVQQNPTDLSWLTSTHFWPYISMFAVSFKKIALTGSTHAPNPQFLIIHLVAAKEKPSKLMDISITH